MWRFKNCNALIYPSLIISLATRYVCIPEHSWRWKYMYYLSFQNLEIWTHLHTSLLRQCDQIFLFWLLLSSWYLHECGKQAERNTPAAFLTFMWSLTWITYLDMSWKNNYRHASDKSPKLNQSVIVKHWKLKKWNLDLQI